MTLKDCDQFYDAGDRVFAKGVNAYPVHFPELEVFNKSRKGFAAMVKHNSLPGIWEDGAKFFSLVHSKIARTPCGPSWLLSELLRRRGKELLQSLSNMRHVIDKSVAEALQNAIEDLRNLQKIEVSPLLEPLEHACDRNGTNVVVLRDARLWEVAGRCMESRIVGRRLEFAKPSTLRNRSPVDQLILFTPPWVLSYNNEEFLVRASVAKRVSIVACAHEFCGDIQPSLLQETQRIPIHGVSKIEPTTAASEFEPIAPRVREQFHFRGHSSSAFLQGGEKITAVSFRLGGNRGTHFRADGNVWVVQTDFSSGTPTCAGVMKIPVEELDAGHMVLMTTSGGGDMIPVVADMILQDSRKVRTLQSEWKEALLRHVEKNGYEDTVRALQVLGSGKATTQNVRNWCSPRNIGMENSETDLTAVLQLIGMSHRREEVVNGFQVLRSAHQSAGRQLQNRLKDSLFGKDLSNLYKEGRLVVRDGDGPSKTIFLVEERGVEEEIPEFLEGEIRELVKEHGNNS